MTTTLVPAATEERRVLDLLDRVAEVRPAHAARARTELAATLAAIRGSAVGALAWESSCLTPSRYPVEFAVTSASDEMRTVVDVIAPEDDRRTALTRADGYGRLFGSAGLPPETAELLRRHQHGMVLRYGAWLGSRHTATASTHKLYVEVDADPTRSRALREALAPEAWRVLAGLGPVRLIGVGLGAERAVELYARPHFVDGDVLRVFASRAGMAGSAESLVRAAIGPTGEGSGRNIALSVAAIGGRITAIAAFASAHRRHRRDHRAREHVLELARREEWRSADVYAAASRPLARPVPLVRPFHTALSEVAVMGSSAIVHHVGMAPPPARPGRSVGSRPSLTQRQGEGS